MPKPLTYRYTECGLDDVIIEGLEVVTDDSGEEVYCIPNLPALHRTIAESIINRESALTGKELRFLRTEMGLTQPELAAILTVSRPTINRWEQGKTEIDGNAQVVIRLLAGEWLEVKPQPTVKEMTERSLSKAGKEPIRIDGSDPAEYRPIAA